MSRLRFMRQKEQPAWEEDPLSGVANLFDVSLAFIVALSVALFSVFGARNLFDESASWTLTHRAADGALEVVQKEGRDIKVQRVTDQHQPVIDATIKEHACDRINAGEMNLIRPSAD